MAKHRDSVEKVDDIEDILLVGDPLLIVTPTSKIASVNELILACKKRKFLNGTQLQDDVSLKVRGGGRQR